MKVSMYECIFIRKIGQPYCIKKLKLKLNWYYSVYKNLYKLIWVHKCTRCGKITFFLSNMFTKAGYKEFWIVGL